jgi:hypothetical protein
VKEPVKLYNCEPQPEPEPELDRKTLDRLALQLRLKADRAAAQRSLPDSRQPVAICATMGPQVSPPGPRNRSRHWGG